MNETRSTHRRGRTTVRLAAALCLTMVVGLLPVTGIPLPFISHGGASLVSIALGLGVIQSINIRQQRAEW